MGVKVLLRGDVMNKEEREKDLIRVQKLIEKQDDRVLESDIIGIEGGSKGYGIVSAAIVTKFNKQKVSFALPSHAALCLNISHNAFLKLQEIPDYTLFQKKPHGHTSEEGLPLLFNLFELVLTNVVFAFTALEAHANTLIPDGYIYEKEHAGKKYQERYNKDQIERSISLDEKLSLIIPEITGVRIPKGGSLWNKYAMLKDVRDRIVHLKSVDIDDDSKKQVISIWSELLSWRSKDASLVAYEIIKLFPIKTNPAESPTAKGKNRWVSKFPFSNNSEQIDMLIKELGGVDHRVSERKSAL